MLNMRKFEKAARILTIIAAGVIATLEIADEVLPNYQRSYKGARRILYKKEGTAVSPRNLSITELQKFYSLLNYLKREGFIAKKKVHQNTFWTITVAGLHKLKIFKERETNYRPTSDGKSKIIVFDVPEKERWKRAWLREALILLGFKMLQRSVWIGSNKIPEQFLFDLREKNGAALRYELPKKVSNGDLSNGNGQKYTLQEFLTKFYESRGTEPLRKVNLVARKPSNLQRRDRFADGQLKRPEPKRP